MLHLIAIKDYYYIADIAGGLHREGDWNDDQTRGCVTYCNSNDQTARKQLFMTQMLFHRKITTV